MPSYNSSRREPLDTFDESLHMYIDEGIADQKCEWCGALFWRQEVNSTGKYTLCCSDGRVQLPSLTQPTEYLAHLLTSTSVDARYFREHIRWFNSLLSFSSISMNTHAFPPGSGPPVLKVQGLITHNIGSLTPRIGDDPRNLQHYFFSTVSYTVIIIIINKIYRINSQVFFKL